MPPIYLDNNATTALAPEALAAMLPFLTEFYGNASSVHRFGQRSRQAIDDARGKIASLVGADESELLFTGGGTEAVNTAVRGLLTTRKRNTIITSTVEHSATRELCASLAKTGVNVIEIVVDQTGRLDLAQLDAVLNDEVALVTLMWANNETGVLFPVEEIAAMCREKRVPLHVDATQAVGKIDIDFHAAGIDAASIASHKFHGPKGVGALYIRRGVRLAPLIVGGPQERGRRGGTENVAGIVGMGVAADIAGRELNDSSHIAARRDRLEHSVLQSISETSVNGDVANRLPNTTNIAFHKLEAEAILLSLSERNICASAGAACSSGSLEPSPVLRAMKIPDAVAHGAVRFSLSRYTTDVEIDRTLEVLPDVIARLRKVLPVG